MNTNPAAPKNIVDGTDKIITRAINARTGGSEDFKTVTTANQAETILADEWRFAPVLEELWETIAQNWASAGHSPGGKENWRWEPQLYMDPENPSLETRLEKGLATALPKHSWANQVPTASGLVGSNADRKRNIDLVHWDAAARSVTLIELKIRSQNSASRETPIHAAFEIIRNALLLCLARANQGLESPRINVAEPEVWTQITKAQLRVVAPKSFYEGFERGSLSIEQALNQAIAGFGKDHNLEMTFGFRVFDLTAVFRDAIEKACICPP